jgi:hypothetical protein
MPIIKESLLGQFSSVGSVSIQPIVGGSVKAKLAVLDIARFDDSTIDVCVLDNCVANKCENGPIHLLFAVTDLASQEVVLPESVVRDLQQTSHKCSNVCRDSVSSLKCMTTVVNKIELNEINVVSIAAAYCDEVGDDNVNVDLLEEQEADCKFASEVDDGAK